MYIFLDLIYCAPELLENRELNKQQNGKKSWAYQSTNCCQSSDIYAFGLITYEILCQSLPFPKETNIDDKFL